MRVWVPGVISGSVVATALVLSCLGFAYWRRRRQARRGIVSSGFEKPELHADSFGTPLLVPPQELESHTSIRGLAELKANEIAAFELPADNERNLQK